MVYKIIFDLLNRKNRSLSKSFVLKKKTVRNKFKFKIMIFVLKAFFFPHASFSEKLIYVLGSKTLSLKIR